MKGIITMFKILTDSACDLDKEYVVKHDVDVIPLYITTDGQNYLRDGEELYSRDLYKRMVEENIFPKSSLPSVQDYVDHMMPYVEKGLPVICITISTSLSGSYNSAQTARDLVLEEHPDAVITVMNSTTNTVTQGLFVNEAVRMKEAGLTYEKTVENLEKLKESTRIFFTIGSLDYLIKNGRIGKLALLISSRIKIKPTIIMKDNEIGLGGGSRTRAKSLTSVIEAARKYFNEPGHNVKDYNFIIGWGYDLEEAAQFKKEIGDALGVTFCEDIGSQIGAVTVCHTGPYALGLGCIRKYETV